MAGLVSLDRKKFRPSTCERRSIASVESGGERCWFRWAKFRGKFDLAVEAVEMGGGPRGLRLVLLPLRVI